MALVWMAWSSKNGEKRGTPSSIIGAIVSSLSIATLTLVFLKVIPSEKASQYGLEWWIGNVVGLFFGYMIVRILQKKGPSQHDDANESVPPSHNSTEPSGYMAGFRPDNKTYEQPPRAPRT